MSTQLPTRSSPAPVISPALFVGLLCFAQVAAADGWGYGVPVTVVNTPSQPVPVVQQGTATVSGNVNAAITNTPNVNVINTPTVTLAPGASVRNADNPANQPLAATNGLTLPSGIASGSVTLTTVPAGKRLVIEYVALTANVPSGQILTLSVVTTVLNSSGSTDFPLAVVSQGSDGFKNYFAVSQLVRLYADAGTDVTATCNRSATTIAGTCTFAISGYFVDVQ